MAEAKEVIDGVVEWSIDMEDGTTKTISPKEGLVERIWHGLKNLVSWLLTKLSSFLKKAWELGEDDPRKVIHCLKVGMALTVVSLFYYMRPLYEGVGRNAMWAVMTVVVVFEYNVGSTISRAVNRVSGTALAGLLGVGVNFLADQSGEKFEPFIIGASVFLLASAATFSRFIPTMKARFDYAALIFILTFCLVSVSGYRVDELVPLACQRLSTVGIGAALCIVVSMMVCPVWAGEELHNSIICKVEKLSRSLEGITSEFLSGSKSNTENLKHLDSYKCVLNSKAAEEIMVNLARWEPAHGRFAFRFPWEQYLHIGDSLRGCAYCLEALHSCTITENQVPQHINSRFSELCMELSSKTLAVFGDVTGVIKSMRKSSMLDTLVAETDGAVKDLEKHLSDVSSMIVPSLSSPLEEAATIIDIMDVIPELTFASLLMEISTKAKVIVDAVKELAEIAEFRSAMDLEKSKQNQPLNVVAPYRQIGGGKCLNPSWFTYRRWFCI